MTVWTAAAAALTMSITLVHPRLTWTVLGTGTSMQVVTEGVVVHTAGGVYAGVQTSGTHVWPQLTPHGYFTLTQPTFLEHIFTLHLDGSGKQKPGVHVLGIVALGVHSLTGGIVVHFFLRHRAWGRATGEGMNPI